MKDKLVIFSAPSGSGKTTIVRHILEQLKHKLEFSISATSRKKRGKELNGKDYFFLTKEEFEKRINNNEFLEYEEVYKNCYYGTLMSEIDRIWKNKKAVIFDIDVIGALNIKDKYPNKTITIFVEPPSLKELKKRLLIRDTDTKESLNKRVNKAKKELSYKDKFDVILLNDKLDVAKNEAVKIVKDFLCL